MVAGEGIAAAHAFGRPIHDVRVRPIALNEVEIRGGNPILSDAGPVSFEANETEITIAADGSILTNLGSKGRLRLVEFDRPQELAREGDNYFSGGTPLAATETRAVQGAIERSNVSGVTEMAEMIRVSRAYQTLASIMQKQDDLRRSAIQRLGDVSA